MTAVLKCKDLLFGYGDPLCIPLTWEVQPGEIWAVAGSNGCGKTTLMRTILKFLKPLGGSVEVNGSCAYIAQTPELDIMPARVRDIVGFGLETGMSGFKPFHVFRQRKKIDEMLEAFDLMPLKNRSIHEISPGERQRAMMAGAIVRRPTLLFLDESTSAMDPVHTHDSFETLVKLAKENDGAVVAISHSLHAQLDLVTHLLVLRDGQYEAGPIETMRTKIAAS